MKGSIAVWFEYWPDDCKIPISTPSTVSCCCFLEQGTLSSLLQSTQLYRENLSHWYCKELGNLILLNKQYTDTWRDLFGEVTAKNHRLLFMRSHQKSQISSESSIVCPFVNHSPAIRFSFLTVARVTIL